MSALLYVFVERGQARKPLINSWLKNETSSPTCAGAGEWDNVSNELVTCTLHVPWPMREGQQKVKTRFMRMIKTEVKGRRGGDARSCKFVWTVCLCNRGLMGEAAYSERAVRAKGEKVFRIFFTVCTDK